MTPGVYNYPNYLSGNTIKATQFAFTREGSTDLTGYIITATFLFIQKTVVKNIGVGITVTDVTGGLFEIDAFTLTNKGTWTYTVTFVSPSNNVSTYITGTITIE